MFEFLSIIALVLLVGLGFFVTVTLHELGHAIPALLMTRDEVTIFVGSFGSPYKSFRFTMGRLEFYCKYNPLLWYKGCCLCSDDYLSIDQRIWFVAGGPIASFLETVATWLLISNLQQEGFFRVIFGSIFVISLGATAYSLLPNPTPRYTPSGFAVYSDTYQIFRLIRMKNRRY
jgi:membrane-associated protease RseP (regulator of RpoE activity)